MGKSEEKNLQLPVTGMSCAACAGSVESMLKATAGVRSAKVNYASESVELSFNSSTVSLEQLKTVIQSIGYDLIITGDEGKKQEALEKIKDSELKDLRLKTYGSLVFTIPIMIISMGFPELPYANIIMLVLTLPVIFWSGKAFYSRAILQLRHKMFTMDSLVALSTSVAFTYSLAVTIFPDFLKEQGITGHVYYEASAVIISFVLLGKLLEARAKSGTSSAIKELMSLQPDNVTIINSDGSLSSVSIKELEPGNKTLVKPGEQVAIDGQVISGDSYVDESTITGESIPVHKTVGSKVYAGTINQNGQLAVLAETRGADTMLARIIDTVKKAQGSKAQAQKLADKVAAVFVPIVIGIAALTFVAWIILGGENSFTYALITSISVLVIACPCALGLATPTAIMVGLGRGAENNILIKDATALEGLTQIDTVVFDKTGTLTEGRPQVQDVHWYINVKDEELVQSYSAIISKLETYSDHPLAEAISNHFGGHTLSEEVEDFEYIPGRGIKGSLNKESYYLGNYNHLDESGIQLDDYHNAAESSLFFGHGNRLIAAINIADKIRDNADIAIARLKDAGYQIWMLTGDNEQAAKKTSEALGIDQFRAALLPNEKTLIIEELQKKGRKVAMIGDGINDSEALVVADISIAMGSGSDIAMDVSQVTLRGNDISLIEQAIALSQQTTKTIKQNLFWAFIYNLIGIPVAAGILYSINGFLLNPMIAAAAMALSSVSVVSNSLLLKTKPLKLKIKNNSYHKTPEMKSYTFKTNINCGGCIAAVTPKLNAIQDLSSWSVDTDNPDKLLTVELDNSNTEIIEDAVKSAGFSIEKI